jgi:hypothetical protein
VGEEEGVSVYMTCVSEDWIDMIWYDAMRSTKQDRNQKQAVTRSTPYAQDHFAINIQSPNEPQPQPYCDPHASLKLTAYPAHAIHQNRNHPQCEQPPNDNSSNDACGKTAFLETVDVGISIYFVDLLAHVSI